MKPLLDFARQVGAKILLRENMIVKRGDRYFLLNRDLKDIINRDFYYAGTYLGKVKRAKFFPSFDLLAILARGKSNKVVLDNKTAWLFICGRDIFQKGITATEGSTSKSSHTLILNEFRECLGFGKIICNLDKKSVGAVIKNISDIGDFLRREA